MIIIDTMIGGIIGIHATTAETREITAAVINTAARYLVSFLMRNLILFLGMGDKSSIIGDVFS